mgnify:CR=1 FL=1
MPKAKTAVNRAMSDQERENVIDQIEQEKAFQSGLGKELPDNGRFGVLADAGGGLGVSKEKGNKRIANLSRALSEGTAPALRGAARNAAVARYNHLAAALPDILLTRKEQDLFPRDGHEYHAAVRKAANHEIGNKKTQEEISEFRQLARTLYPGDAEKASVERLRKLR